jgi:prolyl-tRNA synthetase
LEANEAKLASLLKEAEAAPASDEDVERLTKAPMGFAGPVGLSGLPIIADDSVTVLQDVFTGALSADLHYAHVAYGRDFKAWLTADLRTVAAGDECAACGGKLYEKKGNELGHIFKLGSKYTQAMGVQYLDEHGKACVPTMGCYGIGIDRTLASIIEERHDEDGIIFPVSIAPYHVIIIPVKYDGVVKTATDNLLSLLEARGIEVLVDDRNERPGVKFKDADLIGIPYRVVVGDKNLALDAPSVEIKKRGEKESRLIALSEAVDCIALEVLQP